MTTSTKSKVKLTDMQLVILSAAAGRDSQALLPFPKSLKTKGQALANATKRLIQMGLAEERSVKTTDPFGEKAMRAFRWDCSSRKQTWPRWMDHRPTKFELRKENPRRASSRQNSGCQSHKRKSHQGPREA